MSAGPRTWWGWHQLADDWARRLVEQSDLTPHDLVLDIGAGTGANTRHLAATGARVIAVEAHPRRAAQLRETFAGRRVKVVQADASDLRVVVEAEALGLTFEPALVAAARALGRSALEFALGGGEDYALLCAGPSAKRPRFARRIGRFERGRGAFLERASGEREPLTQGFDHFA